MRGLLDEYPVLFQHFKHVLVIVNYLDFNSTAIRDRTRHNIAPVGVAGCQFIRLTQSRDDDTAHSSWSPVPFVCSPRVSGKEIAQAHRSHDADSIFVGRRLATKRNATYRHPTHTSALATRQMHIRLRPTRAPDIPEFQECHIGNPCSRLCTAIREVQWCH